MSAIDQLSSNQLLIISDLIALAISDDLSADELNVLGNTIVAIGSLILTKSAKLSAQKTKQATAQQIEDLKKQIQKLECQL